MSAKDHRRSQKGDMLISATDGVAPAEAVADNAKPQESSTSQAFVATSALMVSPSEEREPPDWSQEEERQEIFLPVSGFVWLFPEEVRVVNHPAFQRLGLIYQLGQTYVVYRGATHKRFEHSLGALQVAQRMIEAVAHNSKKKRDYVTSSLTIWEKRFVRLGALLHDIGHMAAGHTLEDELSLASRHDEDHRLDIVFGTENAAGAPAQQKKSATDEFPMRDRDGRTLAELIDDIYRKYIPASLGSSGVSASQIVRLLIRKDPKNPAEDQYSDKLQTLEQSVDIRLNPCRDMIGNTICADILDYLHRDWYHIGKPKPFDERLLHYMEIRNQGTPRNLRSPRDRFVISLGQRPKLRTDAISNILDLLEWRYQLNESVLFHRTKLGAAAMLDRALYELWGNSHFDVERTLLSLSDEELLSACIGFANEKRKTDEGKHPPRDCGGVALSLLTALKERELFVPLSTRFRDELPPDIAEKVRREYAGSDGNAKRSASARNRSYACWKRTSLYRPDASLCIVQHRLTQRSLRLP